MFRYLSSTLPHLPSKRGVCKALLLSSSSAPLDTWQPDEFDLSLIQESSTEEADDTLSALLDWSVQWEFQRTKRGAAHQDCTSDYKYEGLRETSPPQGWPVQILQNFSAPLLPKSELERQGLSQQPAAAAPVAASEYAKNVPKDGQVYLVTESSAYTSTAIVGDDRPTLVTASSSREWTFPGLGYVSQCTSVPHISLTSQWGPTAMEETAAEAVSSSAGADNQMGWTVRKNRAFAWPAALHVDEGVQFVNRVLFKMNGGQKKVKRTTRDLVLRIIKFGEREVRLHQNDPCGRQSVYGRIKIWAKNWENHSLDLHGRECELEFYLTVGCPFYFCRRWFASCKNGQCLTINRMTEIIEMENFILEIHRLLRTEEAAMFDEFQNKVFQRFCVVMRNFSYRLMKLLSAELGAGTVTTEEDRHRFLKACLDLLERILTHGELAIPHHSTEHCCCCPLCSRAWCELPSPPLNSKTDNVYLRAFEQLVPPHIAEEMRKDLTPQSVQQKPLTLALQKWIRTNVCQGSFS